MRSGFSRTSRTSSMERHDAREPICRFFGTQNSKAPQCRTSVDVTRCRRRHRVTSTEVLHCGAFEFCVPKNLQIGSLASCRSMLDVRLVRENPDLIRKDLAKRHAPDKAKLLDSVIQWDKEWRKALAEGDALKRRRNEITKEIAAAKKADENADKLRKEAAALPKKIAALDLRIEELSGQVRDGLLRLPNLLHESVPIGKDDSENVEVS